MIYRSRAFPRAALVGNPSDGYFGKTIAFVFRNYCAEVELYESPELDLLPSLRDHTTFSGMKSLYEEVSLYGYYGGIRLLKASIKKFYEYVCAHSLTIEEKNFTIRYRSSIPNRLGLAGSSAIITAALRALCQFYSVEIRPDHFANLILSVEKEELGIPAGLQDRVAQSYNYPVYMDFDREYMEKHQVGKYTPIEIPSELNLYIAYRTDLSEGSEILHGSLRRKYEAGDAKVLDAMEEWAFLTDQVLSCLQSGKYDAIPALLNRNFDLRCEVCADAISEKNRRMVELARRTGASAKFPGSGGAIIGTYRDEKMFRELEKTLGEFRINVIKPEIVHDREGLPL